MRAQFEIIARNEYTKSEMKNPIDCSLYYLALKKKTLPAMNYLLTPEEQGPITLEAWKLIVWSLGLCYFGVVFAVPLFILFQSRPLK
ncbi:hypothetical protein HYQ45_018875 [Verticillium longisporum]|uniref:RAVE complex protein Rav1 C-terminal domain-containing protein n=1 Tax=Verticillium longisporum TaxID=100787 RepID=A0A8I2ZSQ0_VERLO|nr:hypothetical protein HYQ45_018875 [Verticillium longisporum]